MKRFLIFAMPVFATMLIVAAGAIALSRNPTLRPRMASAKAAITGAIEAVAEEVEEAIE
jgi:hypothetical protein